MSTQNYEKESSSKQAAPQKDSRSKYSGLESRNRHSQSFLQRDKSQEAYKRSGSRKASNLSSLARSKDLGTKTGLAEPSPSVYNSKFLYNAILNNSRSRSKLTDYGK